jgi:hypothetical protein
VLATREKLASRSLYFRDRCVEVQGLSEPEAEVGNAAPASSEIAILGILIEDDQVLTAGRVQENHTRSISETLLHPEDVTIEAKRAFEIAHDQVNVGKPLSFDHAIPPAARPNGQA